MVRVSTDAEATVSVGPFSRRGKSRVAVEAADHDSRPTARATPVGLLLPAYDELFRDGVTSKVSSDCLADRLEQWWGRARARCAHSTMPVLHLDDGPGNHGRRTRFMARLVAFAQQTGLTVRLAYSPPYHGKDNPVERRRGILEAHWNGALLDSVETVIRCAEAMTWKGRRPVVTLVATPYRQGVTLTKEATAEVERRLSRRSGLEKWSIDIAPAPAASRDS